MVEDEGLQPNPCSSPNCIYSVDQTRQEEEYS